MVWIFVTVAFPVFAWLLYHWGYKNGEVDAAKRYNRLIESGGKLEKIDYDVKVLTEGSYTTISAGVKHD